MSFIRDYRVKMDTGLENTEVRALPFSPYYLSQTTD